jgi:membrane-associated phospholipid phosphatase
VKAILKDNRSFLIPYFVFFIIGALLLFVRSKVETHLFFNSFHNSFFDTFFYYITFLGDGVTATLVVVMLLAIKYRYAIIVGVSNIISALITQVLKNFVFADHVRPKKFFEGIHNLYFVPGVENYMYNSFPSGHTTCAFSLYFSLALIVKSKKYKFLFFVLALLIGYSRIYLSQHFFEDVYVGSIIGVSVSFLFFDYIQQSHKNKFNKSLVSLFR